MNARRLAYLVLLYVVLTSGALIGAVRFLVGGHDWWALSETVFWLAYLSGALGLLWGRGWSRGLLLVASAASIIETSFGLFHLGPVSGSVSGKTGDPFALALALVWILPTFAFPVFIFVAILRLKTLDVVAAPSLKMPDDKTVQPPSSAPAASQTLTRGLDLAYGSFALIALVCSAFAIALLTSNSSEAEGYGMLGTLWGIPLILMGGVLGLILSVVHWREWPLLLMTAVLLFTIALGAIAIMVPGAEHWFSESAWAAWLCGGLAILIFFCVRWFGFTRRRAAQGPSGATRN
jgi:hypothetical protein